MHGTLKEPTAHKEGCTNLCDDIMSPMVAAFTCKHPEQTRGYSCTV